MAEYSFNSTITTASLTRDGKLMVAEAMFKKGSNFIGAAILLRQKGGYEHVILHLLSQGLENVLKSILLLNDFDRYYKKIKNKYGHNLEKSFNAVVALHQVKNIGEDVIKQLKDLNHYYKNHLLRYGGITDIFIQPKNEDTDTLFQKTVQLARIVGTRISRGKYA